MKTVNTGWGGWINGCHSNDPTPQESHQVTDDIIEVADAIKELVPGIEGEGLYDELIRVSEEVRCMEESNGMWYPGESALNRQVRGSGNHFVINIKDEE